MNKILSFASLLLFSAPCFAVTTGIDPVSVKITIYGVAVSSNADCSNATTVATYPDGKEFDFMQNPTILSGTIAPGTYPCIILNMSDLIKFVPAVTSDNGYCVAGQEITRDVCDGSGASYTPTTYNADKTLTYASTTSCSGTNPGSPINNKPSLFLSTASTATNGNGAFQRPTAASLGYPLSSAFVVTGSNSGTFVVNFAGQVRESGGGCDVGPPSFGFR